MGDGVSLASGPLRHIPSTSRDEKPITVPYHCDPQRFGWGVAISPADRKSRQPRHRRGSPLTAHGYYAHQANDNAPPNSYIPGAL